MAEVVASSGVAPERTVYKQETPPSPPDPFTAFFEAYLNMRVPDSRDRYRRWLDAQDPAKKLAAIVALRESNAGMAKAAQEAATKVGEMNLDRERIVADKEIAQLRADADTSIANSQIERDYALAMGKESESQTYQGKKAEALTAASVMQSALDDLQVPGQTQQMVEDATRRAVAAKAALETATAAMYDATEDNARRMAAMHIMAPTIQHLENRLESAADRTGVEFGRVAVPTMEGKYEQNRAGARLRPSATPTGDGVMSGGGTSTSSMTGGSQSRATTGPAGAAAGLAPAAGAYQYNFMPDQALLQEMAATQADIDRIGNGAFDPKWTPWDPIAPKADRRALRQWPNGLGGRFPRAVEQGAPQRQVEIPSLGLTPEEEAALQEGAAQLAAGTAAATAPKASPRPASQPGRKATPDPAEDPALGSLMEKIEAEAALQDQQRLAQATQQQDDLERVRQEHDRVEAMATKATSTKRDELQQVRAVQQQGEYERVRKEQEERDKAAREKAEEKAKTPAEGEETLMQIGQRAKRKLGERAANYRRATSGRAA